MSRRPNDGQQLQALQEALRKVGLWQERDGEKDLSAYLRYLYPRIVIFNSLYEIVFMRMVDIYFNANKILVVCEDIILLSVAASVLSKAAFALYQRDKVRTLFEKLKDIQDTNNVNDSNQKSILQSTKKVCDKVTKFYPHVLHGLALLINLLAFPRLLKTRSLHYGGWYPVDVQVSPSYEIALCHFMVTTSLGIYLLTTADTFFNVILMQVIAQFKILNHDLNTIRLNIGKVASCTSRESSTGISRSRKLSNRQVVLRGPQFEEDVARGLRAERIRKTKRLERGTKYIVKTKIVKPKTLKAGARAYGQASQEPLGRIFMRQSSCLHMSAIEMETHLSRKVAACVKHHQALISFAKDIQSLFNPMLIVQFVCILIPSGFAALFASLAPEIDAKGSGVLALLICAFMELFIFCYLGDQITEQSSRVRESIYDCDWFEAPDSFKRSLRIIISMANQPIVISAGGYFPLSLEKFISVTKTAYSNYITLMSVVSSPDQAQ